MILKTCLKYIQSFKAQELVIWSTFASILSSPYKLCSVFVLNDVILMTWISSPVEARIWLHATSFRARCVCLVVFYLSDQVWCQMQVNRRSYSTKLSWRGHSSNTWSRLDDLHSREKWPSKLNLKALSERIWQLNLVYTKFWVGSRR